MTIIINPPDPPHGVSNKDTMGRPGQLHPFLAWDHLPYTRYDGGRLMRFLKPFVTVQTSRGCPYSLLHTLFSLPSRHGVLPP